MLEQRRKEWFHKIAADIEEVLMAYHIPENVILYRSIESIRHLKDVFLAGCKGKIVNNHYIYPTLTSTTLLYAVAKAEFRGKVVLRIRCPKGWVGAYIGMATGRKEQEQEILFPPNQVFFVEKKYYNKDGILIIECILVEKTGTVLDLLL